MSFPEDDAPEGLGSTPEDVARAARGCQAVFLIGLIIVALVIVFVIAQQF